jgi:hypothetical protein
MGSYCGIKFDNLSICDNKSYMPDDWAILFQETDRRSELRQHEDSEPDDEPCLFVWYEADRDTILSRLSLLGATEAAVKYVFETWHAEQRDDWGRYAVEWEGELAKRATELHAALSSIDFESWKTHANQTLHTRYNFKDPYKPKNVIEEQFHDGSDSYLNIAGDGDLVTIRALLEACPEVQSVKLDISNLIDAGYYEESDQICAQARSNLPFSQALGSTVILGEGSIDLLVLKRGLEVMHPSLVAYFSFFNHSEFSVDGGAPSLVKFLKAFAAARVNGRFVVIFDNDVIGAQALEQAKALNLPAHFLLTKLPYIDLARCYPTIGPSGSADLDVNGSAAGIELYLGIEALTLAGGLRPVRWTGYVQAAKKYQGEVEGKAAVLAAFLEKIDLVKAPEDARTAFPELEQVWQLIFGLVEKQAGDQYFYRYEQLMQADM